LFFTINGTGYVCSASVVRPHLILTARHCVSDGVNNFGNWLFFPAYHAGANVLLSPGGGGGGWPARNIITWSGSGIGQYDIAFIQMFDDDGQGCGGSGGGMPIESYTGTLGIAWAGNGPNEPVQHYYSTGYPHAAPFTGNWMVQSEASTAGFDFRNVQDTVRIGSDQTGGSSGGPWIAGFDFGSNPGNPPANPGGNFANGLNSYIWTDIPTEINGPQFKDYNFNQLRIAAEALACP
jgi:hypothetical protein